MIYVPKQGHSSDFNAVMKALAVLILFQISLADISRSIIQQECICNKCLEGNISNWFQTKLEYNSKAHVDRL